jgi:hypothetical protein
MSQLTINMHTSQRSQGIIRGANFKNDAVMDIVLGYAPAEMTIIALDAANDPLWRAEWVAVDAEHMYMFADTAAGTGMHREAIDPVAGINEKGFWVDGTELVALAAEVAGFIFVCHGCINATSGNNPEEAVNAGNAMPGLDHFLPDLNFGDGDGDGEAEEEQAEEEVAEEEEEVAEEEEEEVAEEEVAEEEEL